MNGLGLIALNKLPVDDVPPFRNVFLHMCGRQGQERLLRR